MSATTTSPQLPAAENLRRRAARLALIGLLSNLVLSCIKLIAGIVGNSFALIADAAESLADIVGSAVIWGGLQVASRPASQSHPYGYGKAEPLAAMVVALIIFTAGIGIAIEAVHEIITPHHAPAPFTLIVLVAVVAIKIVLYYKVTAAAKQTGSSAVETDAWHHLADALTSLAAFVGISVALIGGKGWEPADDWAALFASGIIMINAVILARGPMRELLDAQADEVVEKARSLAAAVPGVRHVQKVFARRSGMSIWIDMHVWVDPAMTVVDAHTLAHAVKDAVKIGMPTVKDVLIHIEPGGTGLPPVVGRCPP